MRAYRAFVGDRYWLGRVSASWGLAGPWIRPRILGAVGSTDLDGRRLPASWKGHATPETLVSAGLGVGLFWDVLRVEAARGLDGGGWEWNVSINQSFWPYL